MKVKDFNVKIVHRSLITKFIETWHYSQNINGVKAKYCFALYNNDKIIGACIFAGMAMAGQWKKYGNTEDEVIELRRLCCIDDTPKNTESYFISKSIKYLKKYTNIKTIVSYADPNYGHEGTIYKASNFAYKGRTSKTKVILYNNRKYHDKTIRAKYNKKLKPFAIKIKEALEKGTAKYIEQEGKHIYVMSLSRKKVLPEPPIDNGTSIIDEDLFSWN